jgi:hypothetical protein
MGGRHPVPMSAHLLRERSATQTQPRQEHGYGCSPQDRRHDVPGLFLHAPSRQQRHSTVNPVFALGVLTNLLRGIGDARRNRLAEMLTK